MMLKASKKIGILTIHRALNYGAVLQCYALKRSCESLEYEVETIDYNPFGNYKVFEILCHRPNIIYTYLARLTKFSRFVQKYLNPTTHTISKEWIKRNPPQDDIYIVGSDQVWSTEIVGDLLDSYLLDFAPTHVKRISYAASTGGNKMELNEYQLGELQKFSSISLREKQSVPDIQAKVNIPVVDVCDPSLRLTMDDYQLLEEKPLCLPRQYVAYFNLAGDRLCEESVKQINKQLGLPIINIAGTYKSWAKRNYLAPTPKQWLYIIHHADFVCTTSFHGACFSLITRRPFIYCAANGKRENLNDRITNLLEQTHLQDRYITDIKQVAKIATGGINYDEKIISYYRERSLEWLKMALE